MSYNPQYGAEPCFSLPGIRVLRLTGRDAVPFAQSQFMNDVTVPGDGGWQWNGWLDPKGRVRALFALARIADAELLLLTTTTPEPLAEALRRFVFRSKVAIEATSMQALGCLARPLQASGGTIGRLDHGGLEFDLSGDAGVRALVLAPADVAAPPPDPGREATWWRLDIAHGWPALPDTPLESWTPQQLSLQRLAAFSVRKGCYPGQEIVARTHFLGRAKRGLARLRGPGLAPGTELQDASGRGVGQVACVVGDEALAVVPLEPADLSLFAAGVALTPLPLADGLQR